MPNPANLVHQISVGTSTGNLTLTKVNGKNDFATAFTTGGTNVFDYFISNRDAAEWERGTGHMDTTDSFVRDDVLQNSLGTTAPINFSAGTKDITNDVPALTQVRGTTIPTSGFVPTFTTTGGNELQASGVRATTAAIFPATNDGVSLGTSALKFSDLHLASGGVLQFSTEATNITHAASQLTIAASSLNINTSQLTVNAVTADIGSVRFTTSVVAPITNDGVALGTSALKFADLYLADGGVVNFSTGEQGGGGATITHTASQLAIAASTVLVAGSVRVTTSVIQPTSNDGVALGSSALKFADLHLASGGVVQFSTEATNITHAASQLTVAGSTLIVNCSQLTISAVTADIGSVKFTTAVVAPITNDGVALGTSANKWSDLHLASGGVVQFSTEATSITHAASQLTVAGSTLIMNCSQLTVSAVTANIGSVRFTTAVVQPLTNAGVNLGTTTLAWGGLFLSTNAAIRWPSAAFEQNGTLLQTSGTTISGVSVNEGTTAARGTLEVAEDAEYRANTAGGLALTPAKVWSAASAVALSTVTSAVAVDMSSFLTLATLAMATNHTLSDPTSPKVGQHFIVSVATTTLRTLTLSTAWKLWSGVEVGPYSVTTLEKLYVAGFIESSTGCRVTAVGRTTVIA